MSSLWNDNLALLEPYWPRQWAILGDTATILPLVGPGDDGLPNATTFKTRRRTSLAMESEAPYYRLTQLMDDMETRGAPRTVDQMLAEVDAVSADSIRSYFERFPIDTAGHLASVGPRNWPNGE